MALTRDQILSIKPKVVPFEVPAWGGTIYLRELNLNSLRRVMKAGEGENGTADSAILGIVLSVCNEDGRLEFSEEDREKLPEIATVETINAISKEISKLNNLNNESNQKKDDAVPPEAV